MQPSSRTPEGEFEPLPSVRQFDRDQPFCARPATAPCPNCGCLVWFPAGGRETGGREELYGFRRLSIKNRMIHTKREAITAVVDELVRERAIDKADREEALATILHREELGSTGIGRGFAIPHGKHSNLREMVCAVATLPAPVDFDSLDGEPVHTIYVILSPSDRPGDHLRALEAVSRRLRHQ